MRGIVWALTLLVHAAFGIAIARAVGTTTGLILYAVLSSFSTCVAGWLLRDATVESINWRNHVAGFLLPWTSLVGGGQLHTLLIKNALVSIAFGTIVILCERTNGFTGWGTLEAADSEGQSTPWPFAIYGFAISGLTIASWVAILLAWLLMLRSFMTHQADPFSVLIGKRSTWIPLLLPPVAVGISIGLRAAGQNGAALLLVAIPLLILLLPILLMICSLLYHFVIGKPIRWN